MPIFCLLGKQKCSQRIRVGLLPQSHRLEVYRALPLSVMYVGKGGGDGLVLGQLANSRPCLLLLHLGNLNPRLC